MRWIFVCEVKLVKVSLITIILLFISQLRMSNMENDGGGDCNTDLFSTVYYDVDEVKESVIVAKTTQLMLRKQVKNGRKLVENLESELIEAKIELSRLKQELISQSTIVDLLSYHCSTEKKVVVTSCRKKSPEPSIEIVSKSPDTSIEVHSKLAKSSTGMVDLTNDSVASCGGSFGVDSSDDEFDKMIMSSTVISPPRKRRIKLSDSSGNEFDNSLL